MKFNLKCLEFENFRGFKGVFKIEFPIGLTIIYGPVGVGKSSIVQAIQYALYGTQLEVKERIAKLIDLINEESTFTKVKTILTSNGRILEIERLLKRSGEIARETAQLIYENEVIRKDVDKKIIEVLNLDEDDFSRFVLITHRTLEGLIYGTAAKRSLTIDRLFGIEILENIYKAIPIRKLEEILEEEKKKLLSYRELPEIVSKYGSIENAKKSLEEMKKEFEELKKVEEELTKRYKNLLEKRVELLNKLKGVEDKYLKYLEFRNEYNKLSIELSSSKEEVNEISLRVELEFIKDSLIEKLEELLMTNEAEELSKLVITTQNLEECACKIYEIVKKIESLKTKFIEEQENLIKLIEDLRSTFNKLNVEVKETEKRLNDYEPKIREYRELINKYGTTEAIKNRINDLRSKIQSIDLEKKVKLSILEILNYLKMKGLTKCPICGKDLENEFISNLDQLINSYKQQCLRDIESIEKISKEIEELEHVLLKIESMKNIVEEYELLLRKCEELKNVLNNVITKLENAEKARKNLERKIQLIKTYLDTIRFKIDDIDKKIQILKKIKRLKELENEIREIESEFSNYGITITDALNLEEELLRTNKQLENVRNRLNVISSEIIRLETFLSNINYVKEIDNIRKRVDILENFVNMVRNVRNCIKKIQVDVRELAINKVKDVFSQYFKQLYPYTDLTDTGIDIVTRERLGVITSEYSLYAIRLGRKVPMSRLSDGQRLTIALSFILSIYRIANHNINFLIMDEPIPYVDINVRQMFSKLITKLISEGIVNQIIIATQNKELVSMLINDAKEFNITTQLIEIIREDNKRELKITQI